MKYNTYNVILCVTNDKDVKVRAEWGEAWGGGWGEGVWAVLCGVGVLCACLLPAAVRPGPGRGRGGGGGRGWGGGGGGGG